MTEDIAELITRKRHQILVHSHLYYKLNTSLISDYTFDEWSLELVKLQELYPEIASKCVFARYFKDFDGTSGFDLPYHLPEVADRAERVLNSTRIVEKRKGMQR